MADPQQGGDGAPSAALTIDKIYLKDLSLAQYAILAGIPQSPTSFDLVKNAEETCLDAPVPEDPVDFYFAFLPPMP